MEALVASTEALERATETIEHLEIRTRRSILDYTSTKSARERNQSLQKEEARIYYGCVDPADSSRTVCMITGFPGEGKQVVNAHILPLRARSIMGDLGLLSRNIWDVYSCLLLVKPIEMRYDTGELVSDLGLLYECRLDRIYYNLLMHIQVFLYDEGARCYRIYVLFKKLLTKGIENGDVRVTKSNLGLPGGNAVAVFGDIHGLPLRYPQSCPGPYNRLMLYIAKEYCREASEHRDFNDIVPNVIPTEVVWKRMREVTFIGSPESQTCLAMKRFMEEC